MRPPFSKHAARGVRADRSAAVCSSRRLCVSEVGGLSIADAGQLCSPVSCSPEPDDSMEPYTTERLSRVPGGYRALTEPFTALNIDFNDVQVGGNYEGELGSCSFKALLLYFHIFLCV